MKKFLMLLMLLVPVLSFAQNRIIYTDTTTVCQDTVIYHKITADYTGSWLVNAISKTGDDATVELVVCVKATAPASADWKILSSSMKYTMASTGPQSIFSFDELPYDYVGLRFTKNSASAWNLNARLILIKE